MTVDPPPLTNTPPARTPTHWEHPFQLHLKNGHTLRLVHTDACEETSARVYVGTLLCNAHARDPNDLYADSFDGEGGTGLKVDVDMRHVVAVTYCPAIPVYAPLPDAEARPFRIRIGLVDGATLEAEIDGAETPEDVLRLCPALASGGNVLLRSPGGACVMVCMAHVVRLQFEGPVS